HGNVAFLKIGEAKIELLEPLSEASAIHKYLEKNGEGIHHIAFDVDDIDARLKHLKENNVRLINEVPKIGAANANLTFKQPNSYYGVLYELCQYEGSEA